MVRLAFILHLFIGSTLSGVGIVAALVAGFVGLNAILIAGGAGFLLSFPAAWLVAKRLYEDA